MYDWLSETLFYPYLRIMLQFYAFDRQIYLSTHIDNTDSVFFIIIIDYSATQDLASGRGIGWKRCQKNSRKVTTVPLPVQTACPRPSAQ